MLTTKLGVADRLADGPSAREALARATATDGPALRRLLRLLARVSVIEGEPRGRGV